ncbi:MAG TPA: hypothetical protein PLH51_23785 [Polyangiaceae bacterium]|nr:hypothetical protein [Polyangiaceae bacterium]
MFGISPPRFGVCPTFIGVGALISVMGVDEASAASLSDDVRRVERAWAQVSQAVSVKRPQFLAAGEAFPWLVRVASGAECVSVGVLGARTTDFTVELFHNDLDEMKEGPGADEGVLQSVAGAVYVSRCGEKRIELAALTIRMKSPQAALEMIVAYGKRQAPSFDLIFPERAPGEVQPVQRPGAPPLVAPWAERLDMASQTLREMGAELAETIELIADFNGSVSLASLLESGCHRFVASPALVANGATQAADTDLEIQLSSGRTVRDRSYATDALVDVCVGDTERARIVLTGVPSRGKVTLLHGRWAMPPGIPQLWPSDAKAAVGESLLHRRWLSLQQEPVWEGVEGVGKTIIPMNTEPGACYLLAAGATGNVRVLRLGAQVGPRRAADRGTGESDGAALSFCTDVQRQVRVDVELFGTQAIWTGGLWKMTSVPLGQDILP